ncbi:MAG: low temperature requirement protein A [Acidimicrobiales bacterium]
MPPPRLHAPQPQPVTFVELFFDLVFVFAVTQVTVSTARDLSAANVVRSLLLFWLIWWAWTQFTWTLNPADTTHRLVQTITLAATAAAFVMSSSVPRAFADDALWFALPYLTVRLLGLGLQVRISAEHAHLNSAGDHADIAGVRRWAGASTLGLGAVLAGALVDPPLRNWLWLAAILLDLGAATFAGRGQVWDLSAAHISERHGLFVIIALGESLIVAGSAVASDERTAELVAAGAAALMVAALLWWTYFDWFKEALEHQLANADPTELGRLVRDAYSLAHFPLVFGIIGYAVAVEEIMVHPDQPAPRRVLLALAAGLVLFNWATVFSYRRLHGQVLVARLVVPALTAVIIAAFPDWPPFWPLVTVAAGLLVLIVLEGQRSQPQPPNTARQPVEEP